MNNLKDSLKDLNLAKRILKEAYGEMVGPSFEENPNMMAQQEMQTEEGEEAPIMDDQMDDVISQIRELAIKGIAQFADQVESEQYKSLKRIWLETDKFYESMNPENEKK